MLDPLPRGQMNDMVMESMHTTSWKFWVVFAILSVVVAWGLFFSWGKMIMEGLGIAGVNRPSYWGIFLVNTVFWIGISHAGTFISAILRVFKAEFRRPFTRAAELMTTFGLVQAGFSIFMHMGRVWVSYWLMPYPNERGLWPNFHSPLSWDLLAITTYLLSSTMYLFLPLIPDLAMARDKSTGWRKTFYKILALGFRGTEGEWTHLRNAMNIFAFAIIPVMFSVHTIVSWDFAAATRPGWNSTIFGPYFVVGALHSGMGAVIMVLAVVRATMKNMKYFIRPEHFEAIGKLMLIISMTWAYFFFNDYMVQWYGGDKWTQQLLHFHEAGPLGWMWFAMLIFNVAIPWAVALESKVALQPVDRLHGWLRHQRRHVVRTLHHHPHLAHHQPHAVHLAHVPARHRNPAWHWHAGVLHPALHGRLPPHPARPGLGSAGRPDGSLAHEVRTRDGCDGQRVGIGGAT